MCVREPAVITGISMRFRCSMAKVNEFFIIIVVVHTHTHVSMDYRDERCVCCASIKKEKRTQWMKNFWFVYDVCRYVMCVFVRNWHTCDTQKTTCYNNNLCFFDRYTQIFIPLFTFISWVFFLSSRLHFFFIFLIIAWIYYYFTSTHVCMYKIQNPWSNQNNRVRIILACLVVVEAKWHTHTHNISVNIFVIPP